MTAPNPTPTTREAARELSDAEVREIEKREKLCEELSPYMTANGGVVILNGPFAIRKAECVLDAVECYHSDIRALVSEVRRLRAALARERPEAWNEACEACAGECVDWDDSESCRKLKQ